MVENRVSHVLDNDLTPRSALDIFVKDMACISSSMCNLFVNYEMGPLPIRLDPLVFPFLIRRGW